MKVFRCRCGQRVFFDSFVCTHCGQTLGFDPERLVMVTLTADGAGGWTGGSAAGVSYRQCRNRIDHYLCNWLVPAADPSELCHACRLNRFIPNLARPVNLQRWGKLEYAKRRLLYTLLNLGLAVGEEGPNGEPRLGFAFLEDRRTNPDVQEETVLTGYADGLMTINVAEADDVTREAARVEMQERYRTLLGHFRHESGHHYWPRMMVGRDRLDAFRAVFGDERRDYEEALRTHYEQGPPTDWEASHVSAYAASHPSEDWAETWAHYLHIVECLETAESCGILEPHEAGADIDHMLETWTSLVVTLNELTRSMGLDDAYPFVLSPPVVDKIRFVHRLLHG